MQEIPSVGEDMEKKNPSYIVGRNANWYNHFGKHLRGS